MKLILKKIIGIFLFGLLVSPALGQQFLEPFKVLDPEVIDKYKNLYKETVSGDSYNPVDGTVLFQVTDISIPGNFDLPVELTRWIPVDDMVTSDLSGWTWNIPFVRGYYMKHHGNGGTITASPMPTAGLATGNNCEGSYDPATFNVSNRFEGWGYGVYPSNYWDGKLLHIPGKTSEKFLTRSGVESPSNQVTKSNYFVESCVGSNVEGEQGLVVKGPDGITYTFNQIKNRAGELVGYSSPLQKYTKLIMVGRIQDRFGNYVDYNYNSRGDLESIIASDGRQINIYYESYTNPAGVTLYRADYAEANNKRWDYVYSSTVNAIYLKQMLSEVVLPDGSKWKYDDNIYGVGYRLDSSSYAAGVSEEVKINNQRIRAQCHKTTVSANSFTTTVVSPTGSSTAYNFSNVYQGRAEVNPQFYPRNYPSVGPGTTGGTVQHIRNMSCNISRSLTSKVISGAGLASQSWTYGYSTNVGTYQASSVLNQVVVGTKTIPTPTYGFPSNIGNAQNFKTTTVTGPDSKIIYYVDRLFQSPTEGDILAEDHLSKSSNSLLKRVEYTFESGNFVGENWYVPGGPFGPTPDSINNNKINYRINKTKNSIKHVYSDGSDVFETKYSDYDVYGFSSKTIEENSFSSRKKYTKQAYHHDADNWILGLPITTQISSDDATYTTVKEIEYHGTSNTNLYASLYLPYQSKSFGVWVRRYPEFYADGTLAKIEYNEPLKRSDGSINSSKYRYQEFSNYKRGKAQTILTSKRYSDTETMSFSRTIDDDGWVTRITDLNGVSADYEYDSIGRLKSVDLPDSWADTYVEWDETAGQPIKRTSYSCKLTSSRSGCEPNSISLKSVSKYDALYRILVSHDEDAIGGLHRYQNFAFNSLHSPVFSSFKSTNETEASGTTNVYDNLGRLTNSTISGGGTVVTEYLKGNKIRVTDAEGNQTTTTYLAYGAPDYSQPINIASPESVTTAIAVNIFGDVSSVTQSGPGKNGSGIVSMTEYRVYDNQHHLCKVVRNDIGTTVFRNNLLGEIQSQAQGVAGGTDSDCASNASGEKQVTLLYDNLGSPWKVNYPDLTPDIINTRDNNGNVLVLQSGSLIQNYHYNILGLLEDESLQMGDKRLVLDYDYDPAGHLASLTYPMGDKVTFNPNAFGEPTQAIRAEKAGLTQFTYASAANYYPNGMLDSFNYGNGLAHKTTLNSRQLPSNITDSRTGFSALNYSYTYDDNAKITSLTDGVNSAFSLTNIVYDGLGRLTSTAGNTAIGSSAMRYDGLGNITYYQNKKHTQDYSYDANNRLSSVTSSGAQPKSYALFGYDDRGNVTNNSHHAFVYNRANQLTTSGANSYIYDGYNRRVVSNENGKVEYSFYSQSGQLLYRESAEGGTNYIYLGKKLIAKDGVIAQSGGKQHYLPFGSSVEGEKNDVGYTGHKFDTGIGLSYMQARYYDPILGRFYSNDPVGFLDGDIATFNRYSYVGNDPINKNDPTGKFMFPVSGNTVQTTTMYGFGVPGVHGSIPTTTPSNAMGVGSDLTAQATVFCLALCQPAAPFLGAASTVLGAGSALTSDTAPKDVATALVVEGATRKIGAVGETVKLAGKLDDEISVAVDILTETASMATSDAIENVMDRPTPQDRVQIIQPSPDIGGDVICYGSGTEIDC